MKLKSIEILPDPIDGLRLNKISFAENITQFYGPNGSGKTPIIQSILFCLGYPSIFREEIYNRCDKAILEVEYFNRLYTIHRKYSKKMDIELFEPSGNNQKFYNEREYSEYIFDFFNLSFPNLVSIQNEKTTPYLSTILPFIYLKQIGGYSKYYSAPSSFIKNQMTELLRLLLKLPPKNSFDSKKEKIEAKEHLDLLDERVTVQSRKVDLLKETISLIEQSPEELENSLSSLSSELNSLRKNEINYEGSVSILKNLLNENRSKIRNIENTVRDIRQRNAGVTQIINEINIEIESLTLNEESRRIFLSFDEICSSKDCKLFSQSSDAYSKNLLYLKDQIKDLERNFDIDQRNLEKLLSEKQLLLENIKSIEDKIEISNKDEQLTTILTAANELNDKIFELNHKISDLRNFKKTQEELNILKMERNQALTTYQQFSSERNTIPELIEVKKDLSRLFQKWLDSLEIKNVDRDIKFQDDFIPLFGSEKVQQLPGSTKVRAVLAYHASIIELLLLYKINFYRFLVLDTPKQQELNSSDLNLFIVSLKKLCIKNNIQIIFSTSEYHYNGDELDLEINPKYEGIEQKMFLVESPE